MGVHVGVETGGAKFGVIIIKLPKGINFESTETMKKPGCGIFTSYVTKDYSSQDIQVF